MGYFDIQNGPDLTCLPEKEQIIEMHHSILAVPQDSTSTYLFEEAAGDSAVHVRPNPKTVSGILRMLPADATPQQQDSAVQAMMDIPEPTHLSTRPDTLYLPGLKGSPANVDISRYDVRNNFFSDKHYIHHELKVTQIGMAAEPMEYRLSNDDYVTGVLLLSFFIVALFIARNIRILVEKVKNFFYLRREDNVFSVNTDSEMREHVFLVVQTCMTLAILFFYYTQINMTEVFNQISPYVLLGVDTVICLAYFMIKFMVGRFVNWVFFDSAQNRRWVESSLLTVSLMGLLLFVVALLVVYFGMTFQVLKVVAVLLVAIFKLLQLVKCKQIFFNYPFSQVHLIVYFCTLELMPVLLLWKALVYFNEILIVNI